jgi:hypothetical protein
LNSEAKIIIAFLFKRSGKKEINQSEFYLTLSMDLKWFTPKKAKDFVMLSLKNNILLKKEDTLKPNFDINNINIPLGFVPSQDVFYEQKDETNKSYLNIIDQIVKRIAENTGQNSKDILEKIKDVEKEKNIHFEVAALLVGLENNIVIDDFFEEVKYKIHL